jgi:hypothetical protein
LAKGRIEHATCQQSSSKCLSLLPSTCPQITIQLWIAVWEHELGWPLVLEDYIFTTVLGKQLPTDYVNQLVKQVGMQPGVEPGAYLGHLLCIGGATMAMLGGLSLLEVMAIKDWVFGGSTSVYALNCTSSSWSFAKMGL